MQAEPQQLLHITHAGQDEAWVRGVLIPALGLAEGQYWTRAEDDLGALKLEEFERAVRTCRYTLLVASSAARVDQWAQFAGLLAAHLGIEEGKPRLLLVARDFAPDSERARELLPLRQRCLVCLDCSDPEHTPAALAGLAAQLALTTTEAPPTECPYPGLRMFGVGDPGSCFDRPDLFFGRDDEARAIVDQLRGSGRVLLVGPSGCGKSSLARARVLPALGQGTEAMAIAIARPGAHPDVALRATLDTLDPGLGPAIDDYLGAEDKQAALPALVAAAAGPRRLVYVDQLEEVFLDDADERGERARFFERLAALGRVPGVAILLGMRADFYADLMRSAAWDDFKDHRVELAPLRGAALRLAITRPAEVAGVHVEVDLVERLVREADLDRAAEALPLLQVALEQLWGQREWRYLSLASYARIADGERRGLDVVLARHADASVAALVGPAQTLARRVLIDLVYLGEGRPDTRRRRSASELCRAGDDEPALAQVLDHLAARRLIAISAEASEVAAVQMVALQTTGADVIHNDAARRVDLAHDALITGWPALAGWIRTRRDDLRTQRRLEARAAGGGLLAASELPEFTRWVAWIATPAGQALGATEALRTLVQRSVRVLRNQRRRLFGGLFAVIAVLAVAAGVALWQRRNALESAARATRNEALATRNAAEADRQRHQADAGRDASQRLLSRAALHYQEAGRQLLLDGRPFEAVPYLVEARKAGATGTPLHMLFSEAARHLPILWLEHRGSVSRAAFSPDGTRIGTASVDWTARIWDTTTGTPVTPPLGHQAGVSSAAFSPDGSRVVTASDDRTARVWDTTTGKPVSPRLPHRGFVRSAAFSPDGTRVVTASDDKTARVWDATSGEPLTPPLPHQSWVSSAAFSPDGTRVVTASDDNTARIWDAASGKPLAPPLKHQGSVSSAAFSPDGTRVVTTSVDRTARVWDAASGKPVSPPLAHLGSVHGAAFSPDGTRIVTASDDRTARVWDAASGESMSPPLAHLGSVYSAAFSPDGTRIVTASDDRTARVWDTTARSPWTPPLAHRGWVTSAAFSPDGTRVVTASEDRTARVWDTASGAPRGLPLVHQGSVLGAAFSPDGTRVVTASDDRTARIWDASSGEPLSPPLVHQGSVLGAAFSPDGARVVTASVDRTARVWDATSGEPLTPPLQHHGSVYGAAFSPDGARVVTASDDRTARVWDASSGEPLSPPLLHHGAVHSAAFSPDGARIVTASEDRTARIWGAASGRPMGSPLVHQGSVYSAAFSPDGTRVITASEDRTARVWDATSGEPLGSPLEHSGSVLGAAFSPEGTRVITASGNTARIWDAASGKPLSAPLEHHGPVRSAAFGPDGSRVVTASFDNTARVWSFPLDQTTLADWSAIAARSPYVLVNGVLTRRPAPSTERGQPATAPTASGQIKTASNAKLDDTARYSGVRAARSAPSLARSMSSVCR